jgi:hypothetical protein
VVCCAQSPSEREGTALGYHTSLLSCGWEQAEGEWPADGLVRMRRIGCLAGRCRGQRVGAHPLEAAQSLLETAGMLLSYMKRFLELHCWCWGPWRTASSAKSSLTSSAPEASRGEGQERLRMSTHRTNDHRKLLERLHVMPIASTSPAGRDFTLGGST